MTEKRIINVTSVDQLTQGPDYRIKVNEELLVLEGRANMLKNVIQDPDSTKEEITRVSEGYANAGVREKKYGGGSVSRPARNF